MNLAEAKQCTSRKEFQRLHGEMLEAVTQMKRQEAAVIRKLQEIDRRLVYRYIGFNSLFRYAVDALQLTEAQAQAFITVARKAEQLPVLQEAIDKGELTVSKAVRITSVIDEANQTEWVDLVVRGSKREVERAVAEENPRAVQPERTRFLNSHTVEIQVPMNEAIFEKLERARDLVSQATGSAASLETTLSAVLDFYLDRKDPLRKRPRKQKSKSTKAQPEKEQPKKEQPKKEQPKKESQQTTATLPTLPGPETVAGLSRNQEQTRMQQDNPSKKSISATDHVDSQDQIKTRPGQEEMRVLQTHQWPVLEQDQQMPSRQRSDNQDENRSTKRVDLPAALRHAVFMRDRMRCQQRLPHGSICGERRWLEIHHIQPRAMGGSDTLENLVVLCQGHHQAWHSHMRG